MQVRAVPPLRTPNNMRVLVTGASGFIGSHLVHALRTAGHYVIACARNPAHQIMRDSGIEMIRVEFTSDHDVSMWIPRLKDVDVVINTVGIIREHGKQTFDALHSAAPIALFHACKQVHVKKVVQISALGADETAFSQYHVTKKAADDFLMNLNIDWAVLRPSIVYGPGAKSFAFFKGLSILPYVPLADLGDQVIQPIHIDDIVTAVLRLLEPEAPKQACIELVGPRVTSIKELLIQLRQWLGAGEPRFIQIPYSLSLLAARLGGFLGNTPRTAELIKIIQKGNTGSMAQFQAVFNYTPKELSKVIENTYLQQSDIWHARLYFLKPLLRYSLALVWLLTGIVSLFIYPHALSYDLLARLGITGVAAPITLTLASVLDIGLGLALWMNYRVQLFGSIQIATILAYSVLIIATLPEYLIHPFAPIAKNLPIVVATMIMIALERR